MGVENPGGVSVPYLSWVGLLSQSGTSDPTATVLQNQYGGPIVWAYSTVGTYTGTLVGAFTQNKTFFTLYNVGFGGGLLYMVDMAILSSDTIRIQNWLVDLVNQQNSLMNGIMSNYPLLIWRYP